MGSEEDLHQMLRAVTKAKLKPIIDSAAKLENIKDATGRMETGEQFGKIVIEVCN
jgi:D-arabinose 1-dehydrogenase-like Zn-dependent alcohol dehydrogenase